MNVDPLKVRAVVVEVECDLCHGTGRLPGGRRQYGELVTCSACTRGVVRTSIALSVLYDLLFGNLRPSPAGAAAAPDKEGR